MGRLAYKPVGLVLSLAAGAAASLAFHRLWRALSGADDVPHAIDEHRGWGEILAAAALHGAIFAVVKAAVDRGGAMSVRRLTGHWPG